MATTGTHRGLLQRTTFGLPQELIRKIRESTNRKVAGKMEDARTYRIDLKTVCDREDMQKLGDAVAAEFNRLCVQWGGVGDWVAILEDPGYSDGEPEHKEYLGSANMGMHMLVTDEQEKSKGQYTHIDSIGHTLEKPDVHWSQFQGPMSASLIMSEGHRNTQFGEPYPLANKFYAMLDGEQPAEEFEGELDMRLIENTSYLDAMNRTKLPVAPIGTVNIFPKNMFFHRGASCGEDVTTVTKGKKSKVFKTKTIKEGMRQVVYFTLVRKSQAATYKEDKMETADLTVGFNSGRFTKLGLQAWVSQYLIALTVPL